MEGNGDAVALPLAFADKEKTAIINADKTNALQICKKERLLFIFGVIVID